MKNSSIIRSIAVPTLILSVLLVVTIASYVLPKQMAEEQAIKKEIASNFLNVHGNCPLAKKWDKSIECN